MISTPAKPSNGAAANSKDVQAFMFALGAALTMMATGAVHKRR